MEPMGKPNNDAKIDPVLTFHDHGNCVRGRLDGLLLLSLGQTRKLEAMSPNVSPCIRRSISKGIHKNDPQPRPSVQSLHVSVYTLNTQVVPVRLYRPMCIA